MNLNGETIIAAPPETVWRALNDPDVLRRAIPGCESLEKISGFVLLENFFDRQLALADWFFKMT